MLPRNVVRSIWSGWFQQPLEEFPEPALDQDRPDRSDMVYTIWHDRPDRFSKHDLQFEFMDNSGRVSTFRCGAEHFLGSPWRHAGHGTLSLIQPAGEDHPLSDYLLGIVSVVMLCAALAVTHVNTGHDAELLLVCFGEAGR